MKVEKADEKKNGQSYLLDRHDHEPTPIASSASKGNENAMEQRHLTIASSESKDKGELRSVRDGCAAARQPPEIMRNLPQHLTNNKTRDRQPIKMRSTFVSHHEKTVVLLCRDLRKRLNTRHRAGGAR